MKQSGNNDNQTGNDTPGSRGARESISIAVMEFRRNGTDYSCLCIIKRTGRGKSAAACFRAKVLVGNMATLWCQGDDRKELMRDIRRMIRIAIYPGFCRHCPEAFEAGGIRSCVN